MSINIVVVFESRIKAEKARLVFDKYGIEALSDYTGGYVAFCEQSGDAFKMQTIREQEERIKSLLSVCRGKNVYLAMDDDREGEFIAYTLYRLLEGVATHIFRCPPVGMDEESLATLPTRARDLNVARAYSSIARGAYDKWIGTVYSTRCGNELGGNFPVGRVQIPAIDFSTRKYVSEVLPAQPPGTASLCARMSFAEGWTAKETMKELQHSWESGKISYPRTDSVNIPGGVFALLEKKTGLSRDSFKTSFNSGPFTQDGHACLHTLCVESEKGKLERTADEMLMNAVLGGTETTPGGCCEGNIILSMAKSGTGRPGTYASSIEKAVTNEYLERNGNVLHITEKGEKLLEWTYRNAPELLTLTEKMERILEESERKTTNPMKTLEVLKSETENRKIISEMNYREIVKR